MTDQPIPAALGADVIGIDHVGVATGDLDATIAFYRDAFGFVELHREENAEQQVVEAMLGPAESVPAGWAEGTAPALLQVLAPMSDRSTIARFLDRSGPGLQQLALRVRDLAAVSARLRDRGLRLLYDLPAAGTAGSKINFVHPKDAGGVLIELVEPASPGAGPGAHIPD